MSKNLFAIINQQARSGFKILQPVSINAVARKSAGTMSLPARNIFTTCQRSPDREQASMFSPKGIIKNFSVIPLIVFVGGAVVAVVVFSSYFWYTRPEITMFKGRKTMGETMDLANPPHLKIWKVSDEYMGNPELAKLYADIEEAEKAKESQ